MLRLFSAKIFREFLDDCSVPTVAFRQWSDIQDIPLMSNTNYKFCLPVSIGDFAESNVPACFSNDTLELKEFVNQHISNNHRHAFIISDFLTDDIMTLTGSGVITVSNRVGEPQTNLSITFKNPILTYAKEGISPRDLPPDISLTYSRVNNPLVAFPNIITGHRPDLVKHRGTITEIYRIASRLHTIGFAYDGAEYCLYALFYIDNTGRTRLYEVIGEKAFINAERVDMTAIMDELNFIHE